MVLAWFTWDLLAAIPDRDGLRRVGDMARATTLLDRKDRAVFTIFKEQRIEIPLAQVSPLLVKAIVSIEDQRFYEHQGVDTVRIAASALTNLRQGRRAQGAQHAHAAARPAGVPHAGQVLRPQDQGSHRRRRARGRVLEGRDPRAVPEQGLLRRRPARRRGGLARLLRQARLGPHAGRGRAHRRPGEVALGLRADGEPQARAVTRRNLVLQTMVGSGAVTAAEAEAGQGAARAAEERARPRRPARRVVQGRSPAAARSRASASTASTRAG